MSNNVNCPLCGREVKLSKNGKVRRHKSPFDHVSSGYYTGCTFGGEHIDTPIKDVQKRAKAFFDLYVNEREATQFERELEVISKSIETQETIETKDDTMTHDTPHLTVRETSMFTYLYWVDSLLKAHGHKYIKRIPYNTPKGRRYRYIYNVTHSHRGKHAMDESHLQVGTAFMTHTESGKEVHGHIKSVSGDRVTYVLDDGPNKGQQVTKTRSEIVAMMNEKHNVNEQVQSKRDTLKQQLATARKNNASEKQIARIQERLTRLGGKPAEQGAIDDSNLQDFIATEPNNRLSRKDLRQRVTGARRFEIFDYHRDAEGNLDLNAQILHRGAFRKLPNGQYKLNALAADGDLLDDLVFVVVNGNVYEEDRLKFKTPQAKKYFEDVFPRPADTQAQQHRG